MPLRLVEITVPINQADDLRAALAEAAIDRPRQERRSDGEATARLILDAEETGALVDAIETRFGRQEGFSLLIFPVEGALPRVPEQPAADEVSAPAPRPRAGPAGSREELYADVLDMTKLSRVFVATTVLATVVATVGVLRENVAVIIGSMVIAPLLGPNVGLAVGTTLGDVALLRRALRTNIVGVSLALTVSIVFGIFFAVDPAGGEIANRSDAQISDVVLALASGSAGALALTTAVPTALVGVMVAAALLPPTVVCGLMLGSRQWAEVPGPALLLVTNVICVNLAGVVTFLLQGVRPLSWWEADRARQATRRALAIWLVLLAVLFVVIVVANRAGGASGG